MSMEAEEITQSSLKDDYHWSDLELRPYQLEGVNWLLSCHGAAHGAILGDEMGLGKTCQTIAMLTVVLGSSRKPNLVVCPRSVLENWEAEFHRFSPSLKVLVYAGDKEKRADIAQRFKKKANSFDVLLTTYELCLKDYLVLNKVFWNVLVVDEGHRLKNMDSLLYQTLEQWDIRTRILLTGTPVQNNLRELYALLSFVDSSKFRPSRLERFVDKYSQEDQDVKELHSLMKPYFLRRTKAAVLADLPEKSTIVLYHGLSALQKKLYKAVLTKDIELFENHSGGTQTRLMNILMQLRKCVNHPYLFDGVEPEPFELGEHLVEASHKLLLIDRLLTTLNDAGHKVLLFSQMARMLDILQDYLSYRGYNYERLDGSVRGEERFLAVHNFNENDDTFVFLLSTKAGGQGLNLTSADTVIFVDSDFNPQNDLQAAARAHRIGQERPVKVIRLIGRNTVEEIILNRAEEKLKLTEKVIEEGEFTASNSLKQALVGKSTQLQEILKFGVDQLLSDAAADEDVDFEQVLGKSKGGKWLVEEEKDLDGPEPSAASLQTQSEPSQSMYMFEGTDYSKEPTAEDIKAFNDMLEAEKAAAVAKATGERTLRQAGTSVTSLFPLGGRKPRKQLSPEELEERRKKAEAAAEKRAQKAQEQKTLRAQAQLRKREELWKANKYTSLNLVLGSEGEEEEEEEEKEEDTETLSFSEDNSEEDDGEEVKGEGTSKKKNNKKKPTGLQYLLGDVTKPVNAATKENVIVHCTDDSGSWGRGGLFSALSALSPRPEEHYQLAGKVKDLNLGDCHLIPIEENGASKKANIFVALIVAQQRDKRTNRLSGIKLTALQQGLQRLARQAKVRSVSIHLPRIGHDTPGFNWYGTERLLRKHLARKGIPTYIYYFPRKRAQKRQHAVSDSDDDDDSPKAPKKGQVKFDPAIIQSTSKAASKAEQPLSLPPVLSGVSVYFHDLERSKLKRLKRHLVAFDGDVDTRVEDSTTHVVAESDADPEVLAKLTEGSSCCVVTPAWMEKCITGRKIVPILGYTVATS